MEPGTFNCSESLRAVIKYAFISAVGEYVKIEEMPGGKGLADVVFIPVSPSRLPAMIVELKWDKSAEGAIQQIKDKNYPRVLSQFGGELVMVGINYDEHEKLHTCKIEKKALEYRNSGVEQVIDQDIEKYSI